MGSSGAFGPAWAGGVGSIRVTREGQAPTFRMMSQLVDVPVDERNLKIQRVGSAMAEASFAWHGDTALLSLLTYADAKTSVPWARWPRLSEDSGLTPIALVLMAQIPGLEESQAPDAVTVRTFNAAPNGRIQFHNPGILYDWEVDAPAGVSVADDGNWINVGSLASGESFDIWLFNYHDPAATTSSTVWLVESATDGIGTGLATVATSPTNFANLSATPSWAVVSIDGAWTDGYLRLGIETPTDGLSWPVCLVTKRPTAYPPT